MTNLMYKEVLEVGVEYSIKLTYKARKGRYIFEGMGRSYYSESVFREVYKFHNKSDHIWVTDEHIESIEIASPIKPKAKTGKTCPRCLGNKVYEKFAHINGGRCFKCGGTGII